MASGAAPLTCLDHNSEDELRDSYNQAFHDWAREVRRLSDMSLSASDGGAIGDARKRVSQAEKTYRASRDLLTEEMERAG